MTDYKEIKVSREGRVATIEFNRPEHLNSFSVGLKRECTDAFNSLALDGSVGCIVLTGAGKPFL